MSEEIIAKLDELKQGMESLREDVGLLRQDQDGFRLGHEGLRQDVRLLRQGQGELQEAVAILRDDQAGMHKGILRAIGESNESVLAALEALDVSVRQHRVRIERVERKVG